MTKYVDPKIIQKELSKLAKNTNFYYAKAKQSRIKNRKQHDLNKEIKHNVIIAIKKYKNRNS